jgi:2-amino-4-hydroxy-6-hydroxymethyldihydropteridine diphosphokinase
VTDVYIGVGSNIDAERNITSAIDVLQESMGVVEPSCTYRNPPVGFDGDDFLNLVLRLHSDAGPVAVEKILNEIERCAGRARTGQGPGPRSLDLDLLLYGSLVDAELRLPHKDVLKYPFVLRPLAELAPTLAHPITGILVAQSWLEMAATKPPLTAVKPLPARMSDGQRQLVAAEEG